MWPSEAMELRVRTSKGSALGYDSITNRYPRRGNSRGMVFPAKYRLQRYGFVRATLIACFLFIFSVLTASSQEAKSFQFSLIDGSLSHGPKVVRVLKHDRVELVWRSDERVEIHLHGYDKLLEIGPGEPATLTIDCSATGRFPITLHGGADRAHSHKALTYLEVHPE